MLPRAAAAATGGIEAAAHRSEILSRRLLDLEVSVNVGSDVGEAHLTGGVGMPSPDPAAFAARRLSLPASAAVELEGSGAHYYHGGGGPPAAYGDTRRALEYMQSVDGPNRAQCDIAREVEEALLSLRGRIDELISFAQGQAAPPAEHYPAPTRWQAPPPQPPTCTPAPPYTAATNAPVWALPSPRGGR